MKQIKLLNSIAASGLDLLREAGYGLGTDIADPDGIMVRSADMHSYAFGDKLLAIARAGAGVNNIPVDACTKKGVVVFNAPGANANGVKELTVCALLLASRDIVAGINWAQGLKGQENVTKLVESGKGAFAGHEIQGKVLGVVGLGAVGGQVANVAHDMNMQVLGCDPFLSVDAAWRLSHSIGKASSFDDLYEQSDYLTLHVPSTPETKGMINKETLGRMKDGVRIINLARGDLVNNEDIKAALQSGKVARYVTDFPTEDLLGVEGVIAIPHLGASTEEAEDNSALMAAKELTQYLETGNISNSVNFPEASMPRVGDVRLCVLHWNVPKVLAGLASAISEMGINIEHMLNRSKGYAAYTIIEISGELPPDLVPTILAIESVIRVNVFE